LFAENSNLAIRKPGIPATLQHVPFRVAQENYFKPVIKADAKSGVAFWATGKAETAQVTADYKRKAHLLNSGGEGGI
jgi:hypothetical protein